MASSNLNPGSNPVVPINRQRTDFSEIGLSGIKRFGGQIHEEFLRNLVGIQGVRVYREMRDNDPIIGSAMLAIEQVIRKVSWFIEPSVSNNLGAAAAEHLRTCMQDMSHPWPDFITEVLSFLTYGWSYHEIVYKLRKGDTNNPRTASKYNDGLVGWRKIALRMQSTLYEWEFDENGGIQSMSQMPPPDYNIRRLPIEKCLLFRTRVEGNNPEGRSVLRNCYRPWYFKKNLEEIEAIGAERDLVGLPIFKPPEGFNIDSPDNAEVKTYIHKLIGNLRRDEQEGVLIPASWELSLLQIGGSRRQFDMDRIINRYDKRIAIALLAQFIMLGMDRIGSFALSKNSSDLFLMSIQGYVDAIAEVLNMFAVPRLFNLIPKFAVMPGSDLPKFVPGKVSEHDLEALSNYVSRLADKGFFTPDEDIKRELIRIGGFKEAFERRLGDLTSQARSSTSTPTAIPGNNDGDGADDNDMDIGDDDA